MRRLRLMGVVGLAVVGLACGDSTPGVRDSGTTRDSITFADQRLGPDTTSAFDQGLVDSASPLDTGTDAQLAADIGSDAQASADIGTDAQASADIGSDAQASADIGSDAQASADTGADAAMDAGVDIGADSTLPCSQVTCDTNASCDDSGGSAVCTCNPGYAGDGTSCAPAKVTGARSQGDPGRWEDGSYAASCQAYQFPVAPYQYAGSTGDGYYAIDPSGGGTPITVRCDLTTAGGGWTCVDPATAATGFGITTTDLGAGGACSVSGDAPQGQAAGNLACRFDVDLGFDFNMLRLDQVSIKVITGGAGHTSDLGRVRAQWGTAFCASDSSGDVIFGSAAHAGGVLTLADYAGATADCTLISSYTNGTVLGWTGVSAETTRDQVLRLELGETGGQDEGWRWDSGYVCLRNGTQITGALASGDPGVFEDGSHATSCQGYRNPSGFYVYRGSTGNGVYLIDPDGAGNGNPYEVYCDMVSDGGGWTLLGTVSGSGAEYWNQQYGIWSDGNTLGSVSSPWADFKSQAWLDLDISSATIMFQRRYNGSVRAQTEIGNACLMGKNHLVDLFTAYDTTLCPRTELRTIMSAASTAGLSSAAYQEGVGTNALNGSASNGWCWNGGDDQSNTFLGHAGWNQSAYNSCVAAGHLGYIGVFQNGSTQYDNADITGTNWLNGSTYALTDISFFAR